MNRIIFVSLVFFVFIILSPNVCFSSGRTAWEIPDSIFIQNECKLLDELAQKHAEEKLLQVHKACQDVQEKNISPDQWLMMIDPIAREIDFRIPCPHCLRVLLATRQPIPDNFLSYSVFLVPNELYAKENILLIDDLHKAFNSFGEAIGDKRIAIWFSNDRQAKITEEPSFNSNSVLMRIQGVDVKRSKDYCDRFGLNYSDGPYVITTKYRPDHVTSADEKVVIKLKRISPEGIIKILNILEQDLRLDKNISKRQLLYEEVKQRIITTAKAHSDIFEKVITTVIGGK
jgi:hypothetical protein